MDEFTHQDAEKLEQLIKKAIRHAEMGNRTAYKAVMAVKPHIDVALDKLAKKGGVS